MFAGLFDEFLGVPTHPLAVHAPVVLIPILAIVATAALTRTSWRERLTVPLAGAAALMVAMLFAARQSGLSLLESESVFLNGTQSMISRHQDLGNQTFVLGLVWLLFAVAAAVSVRLGGRSPSSLSSAASASSTPQVTLVLNVLAAVALIVTTIWLIRTGHAGSESRWTI